MFKNDVPYLELIENAREIYNFLEDDLSKNVFLKRLEYNITKSSESLFALLSFTSNNIKEHIKARHYLDIKGNDGDTIIIYGAGGMGKSALPYIKKIFTTSNFLFCDANYEKITEIEEIPVISPAQLLFSYSNCNVIIASKIYFDEIYFFLSKNMDESKIYTSEFFYDKDCYFISDIMKPQRDEIFVDGGACDGQTSLDFAKWCGGEYKKIYVFEPDEMRTSEVEESLLSLNNTEFYKLGLWDEQDTLEFDCIEGGSSRIAEGTGALKINVDSVDNICKEPVTFIKLDIEGAELKALKGASETIKKHKPKLAICVYHKPEDIIEIPLYIKSLVPEYRIYIRHHSCSRIDTVLYAVAD